MSLLAIDLGGSHISCAVVDGNGVRAERTFATDARSLARELPALEHALEACLAESGVAGGTLRGIGVGYPGVVDRAGREILSPLDKYPDLDGAALRAWAGERYGAPVRLENDVRLALLGEVRAGAAQDSEDVVLVTLGTGIGGAAMLGGRLLESKAGQAGALGGHLPVQMNGRRCTCGAIGCAEAEASTSTLPAICRAWPGFAGSALAQETCLDFQTLFAAAERGDAVAGEVLARCLQVWSVLTVGLIHAYGPELVLFGGGVLKQGEAVLTPIRDYVERHMWRTSRGLPRIEAARLGAHAALLGVASLFDETTGDEVTAGDEVRDGNV